MIIKKRKLWAGMGLIALSTTIPAHACSNKYMTADASIVIAPPEDQLHQGMEHVAPTQHDTAPKALIPKALGGEGEGAHADDPARLVYQTNLGLVEGHMRVGVALYRQGEVSYAKTHMKHPAEELFKDLLPELERLKRKNFAPELEAVGRAVEAGASSAEVDRLFKKLLKAIAVARGTMSAKDAVAITNRLMENAVKEYKIGVKDNAITDPHEYQDAWGFTQTAKAILAGLSHKVRAPHKKIIAEIEAVFPSLDAAWPDIAAKAPITDPNLLAVGAAKIELAASSIR